MRLVFSSANDMPFGADRALLAWIQTEGFKNGGVASLGTLQEGYFDLFDLNPGGRAYERFHQALDRIRGLSIYLEIKGGGEEATTGSFPIEESYTVRDFQGKGIPPEVSSALPNALVEGKKYGIKLSQKFMDFFSPAKKRHPVVPMPLPLMRTFHNWPLGWDVAQFVLWRQFAARSSTLIPEQDLIEQLGIRETNRSRIRQRIRKVLERLRVVYPEMPARYSTGHGSYKGLLITSWTPPKNTQLQEKP